MNEGEIERLIAELRAMLRETGFGWAAEQSEAAMWPATSNRAVAHALIDAAEAVTVDLAQAELAAIRLLKVDEIVFKPDPDSDGDGRSLKDDTASIGRDDSDRLSGEHRRATLDAMPEYAPMFAELRKHLDGLV